VARDPVGRRGGRGLLAAAASAIVPGAGQLAVGRRRRGLVLLGVTLMLAGALAWLGSRPTPILLGLVVRPGAIGTLFAANIVLLTYRIAAVVDAYRIGVRGEPARAPRGTVRSRVASTARGTGLVVLVAVVALPHVAAGYALARSHAVLDAVFVGEAVPVRAGVGVVAYSPVPRTPYEPVPDQTGSADPDDADDDRLRPLPPLQPLARTGSAAGNPWIEQGRLTVAVLGTDAGVNRWAARSDVMMVVTVDTRTGDAAIFSVDRYMRDFPVPDRIADLYQERCNTGGAWSYLNALYTCALRRAPDEFAAHYPDAPDPGAAAVAETLGLLLGIDVSHHALVDMAGFVRVIDALGGVEIELSQPIRVRMSPGTEDDQWRVYDFPAGRQHLDGAEALAYVRMRDPGDGPRMRRQRCLVASIVENADVASVLRRFPAISAAIEAHVATDMPRSALPDLVEVLTRVEHDRLVGVGFGPPTYRGTGHVPEVDRIRARVRQVLDDPIAALEEGRTTERAVELCD
jgi:polyisoprenyl-teichoic acid--peptidoglycan teichoic acid transferase